MSEYVEISVRKSADVATPSWALWACGFRPFFLGAAAFALFSLLFWLHVFFTGAPMGGAAGAIYWHAHEMLFGFVVAVIAGFLLTAVPKWTNTSALSGLALAGLFALWFAGRALMLLSAVLPYALIAIVDVLFLPVFAFVISRPIIASGTRRNFGFVPMLFGLAVANAIYHGCALGFLPTGYLPVMLDAAVGFIVLIITVVAGRVIPFFVGSKLGITVRRFVWLDYLTTALTVFWLVFWVLSPNATATLVLSGIAGLLHLLRLVLYKPFSSRKVPLLWVLHAGYLFVGLGLVFLAFSSQVAMGRSLSLHTLTAGAMSVLCLGMMARVSLGHTGRLLKAPPLAVLSFLLIIAAAAFRVLLPLISPELYRPSLMLSGTAFAAAWFFFLVVYVPILTRPRADGRPG